MEEAANPPQRRRRALKVLLGLLLVVVLIGVLGPMAAAPFARKKITGQLDEALRVRSSLADLSFNLAGSARVRGLALEDLEGRPLLSVDAVDVDAGVLAALGGTYRAEIKVDGFEVHVRKNANGEWNLATLPRQDGSPAAPGEGGADEPGERALPDVRADLSFTGGRVIVHGTEGETELRDVTLRMKTHGAEHTASFAFEARLHGPGGAGGGLSSSGSCELADVGVRATSADFELSFHDVLLECLAPALALAAPVTTVAGRLDGSSRWAAREGFELDGSGAYAIHDLRVAGEREGAPPLAVAVVELACEAAAGRQDFTITADEFLKVAFTGSTQDSPPGDFAHRSELRIDGDVGRLAVLSSAWVPIQEGLTFGGTLAAQLTAVVSAEGGALHEAILNGSWKLDALTAMDSEGRALDLGELARPSVSIAAKADLAAGSLEVSELEALLGPVRASGHAALAGLPVAGAEPRRLEIADSAFELSADLDRLAASLREILDTDLDLGGRLSIRADARQAGDAVVIQIEIAPESLRSGDIRISGSPFLGAFDVRTKEGSIDVAGELRSAELAVDLPEARSFHQTGLVLAVDLEHLADTDTLDLRSFGLKSDSAAFSGKGRLTSLSDPGALAGGISVEGMGAIDRIIAEIGPGVGMADHKGRGALASLYTVTAKAGQLSLSGGTTIDDFELVVPPGEDGRPAVTLAERRIELKLRADYRSGAGELDLLQAELQSNLLWGAMQGRLSGLAAVEEGETPAPLTFQDMNGEFTYIPDRLGALLAPWLPGKLSGAEEEKLVFALNGRMEEADALGMLSSSQGSATFGLGRFEAFGFDTDGQMRIDVEDGLATLTGGLGANGGTLDMTGTLDVSGTANSRSRIKVGMADVRANSELRPLLGKVHPVFAAADSLKGGDLGGLISCDVDLSYDAPLDMETLQAGWETLPKAPINGTGVLKFDEATLTGSQLFTQMLSELGVDPGEKLSLNPIRFQIQNGRLTYDKPWQWNISGTETTFAGSIGLDESLSLTWNVPITAALVERHSFLESLMGETLAIPLGGTVRKPSLEWKTALSGLAKTALKREAADRLGLGDLLGGKGKENADGKVEDADSLFKRANALWDRGERSEAAVLYKRIREEFKLSAVYLLNKSRIKDRSKGAP